MLSDRRFGVELEHKNAKLEYEGVRDELKKAFPTWAEAVDDDGSGVEVASPILQGDASLQELASVMEFLQNIGGTVHDEDGFHVHHEAPEFLDDEKGEGRVVTLAQSWCNNQPLINEMVLKHRRTNAFVCTRIGFPSTSCYKQVTQDWVDSINTLLTMEPVMPGRSKPPVAAKCGVADRFMALNINALNKFGTIELRQHHGTFNVERACAWVHFGQRFVETSLEDDVPIAAYDTLRPLLKDLGLEKEEIDVLQEVSR